MRNDASSRTPQTTAEFPLLTVMNAHNPTSGTRSLFSNFVLRTTLTGNRPQPPVSSLYGASHRYRMDGCHFIRRVLYEDSGAILCVVVDFRQGKYLQIFDETLSIAPLESILGASLMDTSQCPLSRRNGRGCRRLRPRISAYQASTAQASQVATAAIGTMLPQRRQTTARPFPTPREYGRPRNARAAYSPWRRLLGR